MTLENRVVVIAGATGALGQLAAKEFAKLGARLALVGTNDEKLNQLSQALNLPSDRILLHKADVSEAEQALTLADHVQKSFERADILLQLVGGWSGGKPVADVDDLDMKNMLQQHLWTTFHLAQAIIPLMRANRWGRILAVSSPFASRPAANLAPYAIAKAAQEVLMLTIAQEEKAYGLTANLVLVKTIDTEHARETQPTPKNASWTTPEEIVTTLLHLCSDEAGMINGARIPLFGSFQE